MISVIIPTYERYELLLRAIDSVLSQTYKDIEIIVVDDSSKDSRYKSLELDNRIKYVRLENRLGYPGKVRNAGIKNSTGEWLSFLDDDDMWEPTKLEKQMLFSESYNFICCDAFIDNSRYTTEVYRSYWDNSNPTNTFDLDFSILSRHNVIINSSILIKRVLLESVGNYDENQRNGEDHITWLKILRTGAVCRYVDESLVRYNIYTHKHYTD
jgi:glycosyltransferase involved in cell wall biosynthesis